MTLKAEESKQVSMQRTTGGRGRFDSVTLSGEAANKRTESLH